MPIQDLCAICMEPPEIRCRCRKADRRCKNGHWWHTCLVHNLSVFGKADHSKPESECSCNGITFEQACKDAEQRKDHP